MKENKKATIIDVARLAGVSIATVSRALHNPEIVSKKTRDRVTEAIKSVEYTQNEAARILRLNRSKTIVALVPNIGNPFFSEILLGIESVASENGYSVLIGNTGNDEKKELTYLSFLKSNRADGIILLTGRDPFSVIPKNNGALKSASIPTVVACERIAGFSAPQVFVDNHNAAATATRHLVSLGHRHIAHITGPKGNILTADRLAGYREALPIDKMGSRLTVAMACPLDEKTIRRRRRKGNATCHEGRGLNATGYFLHQRARNIDKA